MLTVACWKWGEKYGPEYVDRLCRGVARNLSVPHRFVCVSDRQETCETLPIDDPDLLTVRDGCYARLRMFDPGWQEKHGVERIVCLDLDLVITGRLDPLFDRTEDFLILHGGHFNPCPFNGSVMMLTAGARSEVFERFDVEEAERIAAADGTWRGSDQTWIAHVAPDAAGWTYRDGIYAYGKPGWPGGGGLPSDARIVAFPGRKDPSRMTHLDWVKRHWIG